MATKTGAKSGGKPAGYKHIRVQCARCGAWVMDNWLMRHYDSGCKVGNPQRGDGEQKDV